MAELTGGISVAMLVLDSDMQRMGLEPGASTRSETEDLTGRLSQEMLAACFAFLCFRDLISTSHVSRPWRSAAFAFPALWTRIQTGPTGTPADILNMAISRAGELSVDCECQPAPGPISRGLISTVRKHMHRFRTLKWMYNAQILNITIRAPLLQTLVLRHDFVPIPSDFLGRSTGNLRTLCIGDTLFPEECPALALVTELHVSCPWYIPDDLRFNSIFALCPRLEVLHMRNIHVRPEGTLPEGPAPPTLRLVKLHAYANCALAELYMGSGLVSVPRIQLRQPLATAYSMAPFLNGALDISAAFEADDQVRFVAAMPDARQHTLVLYELGWATRPAIFVAKVLGDMDASTVRSLRVPLSVLGVALTAIPRCNWPCVTQLTVDVVENDPHDSRMRTTDEAACRFRWSTLECLQSLAECLPALSALSLSVHSQDAQRGPLLDDARELVRHLTVLGDCALLAVRIQGFSQDIARVMSAEDPSRPPIVFDA